MQIPFMDTFARPFRPAITLNTVFTSLRLLVVEALSCIWWSTTTEWTWVAEACQARFRIPVVHPHG